MKKRNRVKNAFSHTVQCAFAAASKAAKVQTIRNGDFYGTGYLQGGQRPPLAYAISLVEGKWKMHVLFWLWKKEVLRYSELKRALGAVTHKMLSSQLKELEQDGIILRTEYPQVPPKGGIQPFGDRKNPDAHSRRLLPVGPRAHAGGLDAVAGRQKQKSAGRILRIRPALRFSNTNSSR